MLRRLSVPLGHIYLSSIPSVLSPTLSSFDHSYSHTYIYTFLHIYVVLSNIWYCFFRFKYLHRWYHIICIPYQFSIFTQYFVRFIYGYLSLVICEFLINIHTVEHHVILNNSQLFILLLRYIQVVSNILLP